MCFYDSCVSMWWNSSCTQIRNEHFLIHQTIRITSQWMLHVIGSLYIFVIVHLAIVSDYQNISVKVSNLKVYTNTDSLYTCIFVISDLFTIQLDVVLSIH